MATSGRCGASFVELPSDVLMSHLPLAATPTSAVIPQVFPQERIIAAREVFVSSLISLLQRAKSPLIVFGANSDLSLVLPHII